MNMIIEVIDGVAYVAEYGNGCADCVFNDSGCSVDRNCLKYLHGKRYRRLTQKEREEVIKALGRGIE